MRDKVNDIFQAINESELTKEEKQNAKDNVINNLNCFSDYFNQVVRMEIFCKSVSSWDRTNEYIYSQMDEDRRIKHDLCIHACKELNLMCDALTLPLFYQYDLEDRHEIASFCGCLVSSIYLEGISEERSFDDLIMYYANNENYAPTEALDDWEMEI